MLSVVVIARDEADRLGRCLGSVPRDAERVVVVDAATTDATAAIARAHGARVVVAGWPGHVAQKNRALAEATGRWTLSLDADEWLTPRARRAVSDAVRADPPDVAGFSLARLNVWLGRELRHGHWYPDRKTRLVRTGHGRWVGDDPHDRLEVDGPVRRLDGDIGHVPYRTFWEHLNTIDRYTRIHADAMHDRGVRARRWDPAAHASLHLVDAMLRKGAWRDGPDGVVVAVLGAVHAGLKWQRLRALSRRTT